MKMLRCQIFKKLSFTAIVSVSFVLFHHNLDAAETQIFSGPVSMAMGGGGRAGNEATEMIFLNPASVAMAQGFETGASYRDGYWAKGQHETALQLSMLENDDSNFAMGGIGFVQKRRTTINLAWDERLLLGALAKKITPELSLGASFYQLTQETTDGTEYTQWNGSVGTLWTLGSTFGVAYVFSNPGQVAKKIPSAMKQAPQQSLAVNMLFRQLMRVTLDITRLEKQNPDKKGIIQLGTETRAGEYGVFRFGYELDDISKRNSITAGIGFIGPRLRANYAFVKPLKETNGAMHSVDLRLPF